MTSPDKTLLIEKISYAEEALERLKDQLQELTKHIEHEHGRMLEELETLEASEAEVDVETFDRISQLLQDAWTKAMSASSRLQELDADLDECETIMTGSITELQTRSELRKEQTDSRKSSQRSAWK